MFEILPDSVPQALRSLTQWVCWRLAPPPEAGGKPRKLPINSKTGKPASTTDGGTWGTFDAAVDAATRLNLDGIGFVFTAEDSFVGIDLDDCRDRASGAIEPWAQDRINRFNSYTEVSPSGTGVHIIVLGRLPEGGNRKGQLEMYDRGRYFTVTGALVPEQPATIEERTEELARLHAEVFGQPNAAERAVPVPLVSLDDDTLLEKAKCAKNGDKFTRLLSGDTSGYGSPSEADLALCSLLVFWTGGDAVRTDALFRTSGLMRSKWDERHGEQTYGQMTIATALESAVEFYQPSAPADGGDQDRASFTKQLMQWVTAQDVELFHDDKEVAFITIPMRGHRETLRIKDSRFKSWLRRAAYQEFDRAAPAQVITDACATLQSIALYDGLVEPVLVRVGEYRDDIYLDLGRSDWEVVKITRAGWEVLPSSPVRFRRPPGLAALPLPVTGGSVTDIKPFINVHERDWPLVLGWLVNSLRPRGPYPVLNEIGPHGSAKTTNGRILRDLIDPNSARLRTQPDSDRDLMISAISSHVQAYDNLSSLPAWLSDALCRLSTGGGYATRCLYTDDDEMIFEAQRPILLTGIEEVVTRPDLLDRCLLIYCPEITKATRRDEAEMWAAFERVRPRILGALLTAISTGLRRLSAVYLPEMPRMADFARWVVACEPALDLEPGAFMAAYNANLEAAVELSLEASAVGIAVRDYFRTTDGVIEQTATEMLNQLNCRRGQDRPPSSWPKSAKTLSAALRQVQPTLAALGVRVEFLRRGPLGTRLIRISHVGPSSVSSVSVRQVESAGGAPATGTQEDDRRTADAVLTHEPSPPSAGTAGASGTRTQTDATDANAVCEQVLEPESVADPPDSAAITRAKEGLNRALASSKESDVRAARITLTCVMGDRAAAAYEAVVREAKRGQGRVA